MTVETSYDPEVYAGDGVTTFFAVDWEFIEETTLVVQLVLTDGVTVVDQVLNSDYTVAGGNGDKGSITMTTAPAVGEQLVISRFNPRKQLLDLETNQDLPAESLEQAYDRGTLVDQEITSDEARNLKLAITTTIPDAIFPDPVADYAVFGKADESGWDNRPITDYGQITIPIPISQGGTNATDAATGLDNLGGRPATSRWINGVAPFVNQYPAAAGTSVASGTYPIDRWRYAKSGPGVVDIGIVTDGNGYDWVGLTVTTANTSVAASHIQLLGQRIEGVKVVDFRLGRSNAEVITLSFKHNIVPAGTYCVGFQNDAGDRAYIAEFTQNVAGVDEESSITLTGDLVGTWLVDNGTGLKVDFCMLSGTDYHTTPGTWQAGNFSATVNQTNLLGAVSNRFYIRDVALSLGSTAQADVGSEAETLRQCRRYYQPVPLLGNIYAPEAGFGVAVNANLVSQPWQANVVMRATPTLATSGTPGDYSVTRYDSGGAATCTSVPALSTSFGTNGGYIDFEATAHGIAPGTNAQGRSSVNALLALTAELS